MSKLPLGSQSPNSVRPKGGVGQAQLDAGVGEVSLEEFALRPAPSVLDKGRAAQLQPLSVLGVDPISTQSPASLLQQLLGGLDVALAVAAAVVLVGLLAGHPDPVAEHLGIGVDRAGHAVDQLLGVDGGGDRPADGQLSQDRMSEVEKQVLRAER